MSTPCCRSVFSVVTPKWREPTRVIRMLCCPLCRNFVPVDNTSPVSVTPPALRTAGYQQRAPGGAERAGRQGVAGMLGRSRPAPRLAMKICGGRRLIDYGKTVLLPLIASGRAHRQGGHQLSLWLGWSGGREILIANTSQTKQASWRRLGRQLVFCGCRRPGLG